MGELFAIIENIWGVFLNCENGVGVWVCGVNCEGVVVFGFSGKKKMWRGFWRIRGQGGW